MIERVTDSFFKPKRELTVLLVEDSPFDAGVIKAHLKRSAVASFEVDQSTTLADAIERLEGMHSDVILLDLNLPDSRGFHRVALRPRPPVERARCLS